MKYTLLLVFFGGIIFSMDAPPQRIQESDILSVNKSALLEPKNTSQGGGQTLVKVGTSYTALLKNGQKIEVVMRSMGMGLLPGMAAWRLVFSPEGFLIAQTELLQEAPMLLYSMLERLYLAQQQPGGNT